MAEAIGELILGVLVLVVIAVAVPLIFGGIVGGVVASKRKKGVWKGVGVGVGYGSLLVVLVIGVYESYGRLYTALEERGARKQVEKEAKIWAKKNGLDDHRIILDAVDISSLWQNNRFEGNLAPSRDYTGWVKMMNGNGQIEVLGQLKDGLFITIAVWKPNGEKCPATNVKKGNGVRVWYNKYDQTEDGRWIYKDGNVVSRTSHHSNGQKRWEYAYKDGEKHGLSTGWYQNGQKREEGNFKDGEKHGLETGWYSNGQKEEEATYKDGEKDGLGTEWYSNGQKESEIIYKDWKRVGLSTWWYENGRKKAERTHKDGKLWTAVRWKPNGEKCPLTNLVNGSGVVVQLHPNPNVLYLTTYKDGKIVKKGPYRGRRP
jgi:antitoxin component YwqK of YwqJK toxin-antitoxin module